ncbi:MAG: S-adenosylmethionine:tRNA ribosyltransferase-isomerase [Pseudonocardiaceae bacterium]|nr:S-adenosylmethionine:tRNA ribosyltransferase-isomerase [Pseudonocardiaceae bacterium]
MTASRPAGAQQPRFGSETGSDVVREPRFGSETGFVAATGPPETRGVTRDRVRMLVATPGELDHRVIADLPGVLRAGDLLVVNSSDTLPAALTGVTARCERVEVHLSTLEPSAGTTYPVALAATASHWVVEVRAPGPPGGVASWTDRTGAAIHLADGGELDVGQRYAPGSRLWTAQLHTPVPLRGWLADHGQPIRYSYAGAPWPLSAYRTEYADTPGSAEMPSAGRPLTRRVLRRLAARGVEVAAVLLHTGVSSAEAGEPPYAEWFAVSAATAAAVTRAHRVIAVGTTVVRALETTGGTAGTGWTDLVVTPEHRMSSVDGLLTGWHEPAASHLQMLQAIAGPDLLAASYTEALRAGYRWHEFGDTHLILPG